jgi:hypothetical protein
VSGRKSVEEGRAECKARGIKITESDSDSELANYEQAMKGSPR